MNKVHTNTLHFPRTRTSPKLTINDPDTGHTVHGVQALKTWRHHMIQHLTDQPTKIIRNTFINDNQETKGKRILVRSKADLQKAPLIPPSLLFDAQVATSAITGEGTLELQSAIVSVLVPEAPDSGIAIPFRTRHIDLLNRLTDL